MTMSSSPTGVAPAPSIAPDQPAGPRGLPLLGSLLSFTRDPLGFVETIARRYGDVARFSVAGIPTFLLSHPDHVQEVLVSNHAHQTKDQITRGLARILGQGLLTSEGATWRRQRKIAAPSFSRADVAVYGRAMVARAHELADQISRTGGSVRDVHADMTRVTLDVVVRTLFARDVAGADDIGPTVGALLSSYRHAHIGLQRVLPEWVPTPSRRTLIRSTRRIDDLLAGVIREARASDQRGSDLLSRLLAATDDDGAGMDDRQLRDEIVTMFLAGHETTAIALTAALFLLAKHPEIGARVRSEVDEVLAGRAAEAADLTRLRFTDAVVRESMRLYPPAWIIGREAVRELRLGKGVVVPAGGQVLISQWVIHRDARWFAAPDAFRPDRWLDGSTAELHRHAYIPFGSGPRVCIGNHFAMLEAVLILATLVQRLDLAATPDSVLELVPAVTLRPARPVRLRMAARADRAARPEPLTPGAASGTSR